MKLFTSFFACSVALLPLVCCTLTPVTPDPPFEADPELEVAGSIAGDLFALDLFRVLAAEGSGNITFSPASLESVLHLLKEGAAGTSKHALNKLPLGRQNVKSAMQVRSANALFVADELKLKTAAAAVQRVPFASDPAGAVRAINDWFRENTKGLISKIATEQSITFNTRLVLANAIYLKELWLRPFDKDATEENGDFHCGDGSTVNVALMCQKDDFRYAEGADWKAVALFYRTDGRAGEPGCFIGILPKGNARAFARGMTLEKYDGIRRALARSAPQEVRVFLPRMDIDSSIRSLKPALCKLGLAELFSDKADLSGFADEPLALSDVLQRCRVIVSEKETVAAAVTIGTVPWLFIPDDEPREIRFDRPFIWGIGDLTTAAPPYFIGFCEKPASK